MVDGVHYMSPADAADRYGVSRETILNMVYARRIPFLRVGRQIRLDPNRLDALFAAEAEAETSP
jgi:excisionase family DNA binding protein